MVVITALSACEPSATREPATYVPPADDSEQLALPAGTRRFGIAIIDTPHQDFDDAIGAARSAGADHVELVIGWDDIETAPGEFQPETDWAAIANRIYPGLKLSVALSFLTVDTLDDRRPAWRQATPWDDPQTIAAAWTALSRTLQALESTTLLGLSLGNEANIALAGQVQAQAAYIRFASALRKRVKQRYPDLAVGVKLSASELFADDLPFAQALTSNMDVALLPYYPLDSNAVVRDPQVPADDFSVLVEAFPDHPIQIAEIGYPSSTQCGCSETHQAEFVRAAFAAWDAHAGRISRFNWTWQTDITPQGAVDYAASLGSSSVCFAQFLGTLGLKDYRARPKLAWQALLEQTAARRFGGN